MSVLEVEQGEGVDRVAGTETGRDGLRLPAERKRPVTSAPSGAFSTVEARQDGPEERAGGAETEQDGAHLSDAEETLSILKTEKHQLEGRVTSAETEKDGARFALKKE